MPRFVICRIQMCLFMDVFYVWISRLYFFGDHLHIYDNRGDIIDINFIIRTKFHFSIFAALTLLRTRPLLFSEPFSVPTFIIAVNVLLFTGKSGSFISRASGTRELLSLQFPQSIIAIVRKHVLFQK